MLRGVFILLLGLICLGCNAQERMNAVLIVLDDMNDYIGVMGGHPQAKTPNIDQLANEGVFFANADRKSVV